jgi:hypothetical protein
MKFSILSILAVSANAFSVVGPASHRLSSSLRSTSSDDNIAALRAAAAKARAEADKLSLVRFP